MKDDDNNTNFKCKWCLVTRSLSNMGRKALTVHMNGAGHKNNRPEAHHQIQSYFFNAGSSSSRMSGESSGRVASCESGGVSSSIGLISKAQTATAEILWALHAVKHNYSASSCNKLAELNKKMFPDSAIAQTCQMARTKLSYMINFGLGPHFENILLEAINKSSWYSVSFDESYNDIINKSQMDIVVRYIFNNRVVSQYLTTKFLGHTTAEDLKESLLSALQNLNQSKLVQISMDGPNSNWSMYRKIKDYRKEKDLSELVNIGSCSLHIAHRAFELGADATKWKLDDILKSLHKLFKKAGGRRTDYNSITGSNLLPYSFCKTRWLDDKLVADRAIEIWPNIKKMFQAWELGPKNKCPDSRSYRVVRDAVADDLTIVKMYFFSYVASLMEPFLRMYQSTKPIVPFMHEDISCLVIKLMCIVIKEEIISNLSLPQLFKIEMNDKASQKPVLDLGCAATNLLAKLRKKDLVEEQKVLNFNNECRVFVIKAVENLRSRMAVGSTFIKNISSLNPENLEKLGVTIIVKRFTNIVHSLTKQKMCSNKDGDASIEQFRNLVNSSMNVLKFKSFKRTEERLDQFYFETLEVAAKSALGKLLQSLFVLHNGQAEVERGFSINKALLENNMREQTIVSRRRIIDYLYAYKLEPYQVHVSKDMQMSVAAARSRYDVFF